MPNVMGIRLHYAGSQCYSLFFVRIQATDSLWSSVSQGLFYSQTPFFDMASFLPLLAEFVLLVFALFSELFTLM